MITLEQVLAWTEGRCDRKIENQENIDFTGVNTDTRTIQAGELFIALRGENFDGHAYAAQAVAKGAAGVVASREVELAAEVPVIRVADTLKAYQDIAHGYRMSFPELKVVAITGSNGKTSTKDMVATALSARYRVVKTRANFNNEIGLPRTLLSIRPDTEIAVVEMGMRGLGQIREMCAIARPDVGLITNVGSTHIGELGSLENIAKAKSEILEDLPEDGLAVLNGDLELVRGMEGKLHTPAVWFGMRPEDDVQADRVEITAEGSSFRCLLKEKGTVKEEAAVRIPQIGEHNVMNALSALAVGRHFGVKLNDMVNALSTGTLTGNRQEVLRFGGFTVVNDAYNASPASMEAAFATLKRLKEHAPGSRTIAVLADMLELGDTSAEAHASVGRMAVEADTDFLLAYGNEAVHMVDETVRLGGDARHFTDREAAAAALEKILQPGDIVLLKGSHSMGVSGIIDRVFKK